MRGVFSPPLPLGERGGGEGLRRMPPTLPPCQTGLALAMWVRRLKCNPDNNFQATNIPTLPACHALSGSRSGSIGHNSLWGTERSMVKATGKVPAADLLVRRLGDYGVRHVFGYPGGQLTPIYDALYREPDHPPLPGPPRTGRRLHGRRLRPRHRPARRLPGRVRPRRLQRRHAAGHGLHRLGPAAPHQRPGAPRLAWASAPATTTRTTSSPPAPASPRRCFAVRRRRTICCRALDQAWLATDRRAGPARSCSRSRSTCCAMKSARPPANCRSPALPARPFRQPAKSRRWRDCCGRWRKPLILAGGGVVSAGAEAPCWRSWPSASARRCFTPRWASAPCPPAIRWRAGMPWLRATSDLTGMEAFFSPLFAAGRRPAGHRLPLFASWPPAAGRMPLPRIRWPRSTSTRRRSAGTTQCRSASSPTPAQALEPLLPLLPEAQRPPWTTPPARASLAPAGAGPARAAAPRAAARRHRRRRRHPAGLHPDGRFPARPAADLPAPGRLRGDGLRHPRRPGAKAAFPERRSSPSSATAAS